MLNWYWAEDDVRGVIWPERHRDYLSDTPLEGVEFPPNLRRVAELGLSATPLNPGASRVRPPSPSTSPGASGGRNSGSDGRAHTDVGSEMVRQVTGVVRRAVDEARLTATEEVQSDSV